MVDDRLDDVLASVGRHLVIDASVDVRPSPVDPDRAWPRSRRRLLVAAIVVAVLGGSVASIPPARRVVGGWFSAGRIDVSIDPNVTIDPGLPAFIDAASPIDLSDATEVLGTPPPDLATTSLGAPTGWWTVPEGGVLLTWNESETSLWMVPTEPHLEGHLDKVLNTRDAGNATWIPDLGNGGIAIDAPHVLLTPQRRVAADSVVAWDEGGITFRLESTIDIDQLVLAARSIAAIP